MFTKIIILLFAITLVHSASKNRFKRQYAQQVQAPVQILRQNSVPLSIPSSPISMAPPIVASGGGLIDLLLLGSLLGGRGSLFGGSGHGRYGRDTISLEKEAKALETEEPIAEQEINFRNKRQIPFQMNMDSNLELERETDIVESQPNFGGSQLGLNQIQPGFGGIQPGFGGIQPGFGGPQSGFGGIQPGFGGPQSGFGGPQSGFGGPQSGFGGIQPGFGGPQSGFGGIQPGFDRQSAGIPVVAPVSVGGLGITGSPLIDLFVLKSVLGNNGNGNYKNRHRKHRHRKHRHH